MSYQEFRPHQILAPYIDAYWVMKGEENKPVIQRIMPDGCIDIMLNFGSEFLTDSGKFTMKNDCAYLLGTMTQYVDIVRKPDTHLLGIRFKPLGFSTFYKITSLYEISNKTVDFERKLIPEIHQPDNNTINLLDKFFINRISRNKHALTGILSSIQDHNGNISIEKLSKQHLITSRSLERNFKQYLGIRPKEYMNFVRYQYALKQIKQNSRRSLLDIAFDAGFYDHSHLTNEVKKYSGLSPSQL